MENEKSPNEFAKAMLERSQDSGRATKPRDGRFGDRSRGMFSRIEDRESAIKVARESGFTFIGIAVLQAVVAFFIGYMLFVDAFIYAVLGAILLRFKSRVAAVILSLLATVSAAVTVANATGAKLGGGNNIVLSIIILWAGLRAVEATFKLHGRFSAAVATQPE